MRPQPCFLHHTTHGPCMESNPYGVQFVQMFPPGRQNAKQPEELFLASATSHAVQGTPAKAPAKQTLLCSGCLIWNYTGVVWYGIRLVYSMRLVHDLLAVTQLTWPERAFFFGGLRKTITSGTGRFQDTNYPSFASQNAGDCFFCSLFQRLFALGSLCLCLSSWKESKTATSTILLQKHH